MNNLQIKILYEQPLEILIEYPVAVLALYHGSNNLDKTWDDNILPIIAKALHDHQVTTKNAALLLTSDSKEIPGKLTYQLSPLVKPPLFDLNWLTNALATAGFARGLYLKMTATTGVLESCYGEIQ